MLLLAACGGSGGTITTLLETYYQSGKKDSKGRPILVPGDQGPEVLKIQKVVNDAKVKGISLKETGVYDDETLAIMLAFQCRHGLQPDGVIGPNTWDRIEKPKPINTALDPLTLVDIAKVAIDSPSDVKEMLGQALADAGVTTTRSTEAKSSGGGSSSGGTSGGGGSGSEVTLPLTRWSSWASSRCTSTGTATS